MFHTSQKYHLNRRYIFFHWLYKHISLQYPETTRGVSSCLISSRARHIVMTDCWKWQRKAFGWPPMAYRSHKLSWKSIKRLNGHVHGRTGTKNMATSNVYHSTFKDGRECESILRCTTPKHMCHEFRYFYASKGKDTPNRVLNNSFGEKS
jgi:hypothetical protein